MTATTHYTFEAAHSLVGHPKCGRKHGHSYNLWVTVYTAPTKPITADFGLVKKIVKQEVIDELDHQDLNDIIVYPSAERICAWVYRRLKGNFRLFAVKLAETADSFVVYIPEDA